MSHACVPKKHKTWTRQWAPFVVVVVVVVVVAVAVLVVIVVEVAVIVVCVVVVEPPFAIQVAVPSGRTSCKFGWELTHLQFAL
jgi:hypothetical protein